MRQRFVCFHDMNGPSRETRANDTHYVLGMYRRWYMNSTEETIELLTVVSDAQLLRGCQRLYLRIEQPTTLA